MKKHFVLGALAVLALAACTKSEVVELNKGNEISLTAVTGKNITKAQDGFCNSNKPGDFQVWASTTADPKKVYFQNETYTKDGDTDTYKSEIAHYWPEEHLDFFAAKNHNGTVTFNPSAAVPFKFTGYTVNSTVSAQTDFIYAVNKDQAKGSGKAPLNFRPALSQIEFKAKNSNSSIRVFIDGIKVANVKSKGNFEVTGETDDAFVDHDHAFDPLHPDSDTRPAGTRGEWKNQDLNATYSVTFAEKGVASGSTVDLTYSSGEYNTNSMYLLPQTLSVWDGSVAAEASGQDKAYFVVNALIYNVADPSAPFVKADNVVLWGTESSPGVWTPRPIAVKIPAGQWEDGKRYVYTFNFTNYGTGGTDPGTGTPVLTPIELTVTVDDFVDAGETNVNVE